MHRKLKCSNPNCDGVFAHQIGKNTLDIARKKQQFTLSGRDYQIIGTCAVCNQRTTFSVTNGIFDEDGVTFKEDAPVPPVPPVTEPVTPPTPPAA